MQTVAALQASSASQAFAQRSSAARAQRGSLQVRAAAATGFWDTPTASTTNGMDSIGYPPQRGSWIEKPEAVKDFATLQSMLDEINSNISLRQDTISLLTGEVQRLRGQMGGLDGSGLNTGASYSAPAYVPATNGATPSSFQLGAGSPSDKAASMAASMLAQRADAATPSGPAALLQNIVSADRSTAANVGVYAASVAAVVFAGGVVAPVVEDKMGLGGAAYYDFITSSGLPNTMAEVDPIVASHAGGAVGILTAQLAAEAKAAQRSGRRQ